jgi:hypothetical protein
MRRANNRRPEIVTGPQGQTYGYSIDLSDTSVSEENIFYNYDEREPASVTFKLSNGNELVLFFPEVGSCYLIPRTLGRAIQTPSGFRSQFNCGIGFVPILGPVEQHERLFDQEAARRALFNYKAARNFRNIWYHYPEKFGEFRDTLRQTWPGMDVEPPKIERSHEKPRLYMFCPEERIPREIFWAGFGFQVWCQMLTHLIQSQDRSLFLIDEPDIYLHSELQRQLMTLLRGLGPDILLATHSVEIITEAEPDDIVLINKKRPAAKRIKRPSELSDVFSILGTGLNPTLTQLAKTRRAVFVEGKDFQVVSRFAARLGVLSVGNRTGFAAIPVGGFNPERVRSLKIGMETTLGRKVAAASIFDRDYRSHVECEALVSECKAFCDLVVFHDRKEIENYLLVPAAIDRAAQRRVTDHAKRGGTAKAYTPNASEVLAEFAAHVRPRVISQYIADRKRFERARGSANSEATINESAISEFEKDWSDPGERLKIVPGKEALASINQRLQEKYGVSVTLTAIVSAMQLDEIPTGMKTLVEKLSAFSEQKV